MEKREPSYTVGGNANSTATVENSVEISLKRGLNSYSTGEELGYISAWSIFEEKWASGGSDNKESASNTGDAASIPRSGRAPGGGHGNPLQYSCLGNPMDRGVWQALVHGVTKGQILLSEEHFNYLFSSKVIPIICCCCCCC